MSRYEQIDQGDAASVINILAGLWLIISAFLFRFTPGDGGAWNSIIVGIVIALFAAARFASGVDARGLSWVNVVLGAWMIVSPFVYAYTGDAGRTWNSVIVGIIVLVVAFAAASADEVIERRGSAHSGVYRDWGGQSVDDPYWDAGRWPYASGRRTEGLYRGIGPQGYRRGDEHIQDEICALMTADARLDASDIDVRIAGGEVSLQGSVPTRLARRIAEEISESVIGVHDVNNELRVRSTVSPEAHRRAA